MEEVSASQKVIMKFFAQFPEERPCDWSFKMRKWRQTLTGFLIGYYKNLYNNPVNSDDLQKSI